jgi:hypothetical protein
LVASLALAVGVNPGVNPIVGGKETFPTKNIIENAANSADHTTLVAAVKAAGLVDTLSGRGRSRFSRQSTRLSKNCQRAPSTTC